METWPSASPSSVAFGDTFSHKGEKVFLPPATIGGYDRPTTAERKKLPWSWEERVKLGLLTAPFPDTPLMEVADWACSAGFEALEIACWPKSTGPTRRYAGTTHIDVASTLRLRRRRRSSPS